MMDGYDVLVVIDDLKRHAEAYREISLISGKTPGRDAYPADIFYTHSRLLEKGCQHKNGGSITILPIVETKGGDITDYISTNIISITDGQIVLSAKSFQKGDKPAIDYGLSVSRLGGAVQEKDMKAVGSVIRRKLLSYLETRHVYELVNADEMSIELKNQFMEGKFILDNLNQYKFSAKTPNEIISSFSELLNDDNSQSVQNVVQNTNNVSVQAVPQVQNVAVESYNQNMQPMNNPQVSVENNIPTINTTPQVVESAPVVVSAPQIPVESAPVMVQAVPEIVETLEQTQVLELPPEEEVL